MTKTLYYCDICRDQKELSDLVAVEFGNDRIVVARDPRNCARHLCEPCVEAIGDIAAAVKVHGFMKARCGTN